MERRVHPLVLVAAAVAMTLPWIGVALTPVTLGTVATVAVSGVAILGAAFLLAWGAETAEKDVPTAFAIAVLAVLAVAPEYAVDALYAWSAGAGGATTEACAQFTSAQLEGATRGSLAAACHDANLAIANMTGANRILIGLGWSGIAIYTVYRAIRTGDTAVIDRPGVWADAVRLDPKIATEVAFLFVATMWAFLVPLGGGIGLLDTAFLVGLYLVYIAIVIRGDVEPDDHHGSVPEYFQAKAKAVRASVVLGLFAYSGAAILLAVKPFAHGLEDIGVAAGLPEFFMIQWVAPLASETPELIVVAILVNRARATAGFNALISSKLNQWTLLIGTLAVVFSIASGAVGTLPFDEKQSVEIWLTAAQSLFALAVLINFQIEIREAVALLVLFCSQVGLELLILRGGFVAAPEAVSLQFLWGFTALYVLISVPLLVYRRDSVGRVLRLTLATAKTAMGKEPATELPD